MNVSVGIDVAEARKGLDLVALAGDRTVVTRIAHATVADVSAMIADLRPDVVCIDSPPAWATSGRSRAAERELRTLGITAYSTPTDPGPHTFYRWMRVGFSIFAAIADDYPRFRAAPVRHSALEVFPEASAVLLKGSLRPVDESKAQFRRGILEDHGVDASALITVDSVDAALGALTGLLALEGEFSIVGDRDEGVIVLPGRVLPSVRLVRPAANTTIQRISPTSVAKSGGPTGGQTCLCGCGAIVRRRFLPGHDSKLKSSLLRLRAGGDANAAGQLRDLGWANDDPASDASLGRIVAGAVIVAGECGEDDITSANLEQMAATLETRPPTDNDRRELVEILRWLAKVVRELDAGSSNFSPPSTPVDDRPPE